MSDAPPISWDRWPLRYVWDASLAILEPVTLGMLRNGCRRTGDMLVARAKVVGAIKTCAVWDGSFPEIAALFGQTNRHNSYSGQYDRWMRFPRSVREDFLFRVLVQMHADWKASGETVPVLRFVPTLDEMPGRAWMVGRSDVRRWEIPHFATPGGIPFRKVCAH